MEWNVGAIIAMIALILVIVGHLCTTVWWMSKITTLLDRMARDITDAMSDIKGLVKKEDCLVQHDKQDKRFDDVWKAIDDLRKK